MPAENLSDGRPEHDEEAQPYDEAGMSQAPAAVQPDRHRQGGPRRPAIMVSRLHRRRAAAKIVVQSWHGPA